MVGNINRSAGNLISGGSATVQPHSTVPQQQIPYQQPVIIAPQASSNNYMLMIGAGVAVLGGCCFAGREKGEMKSTTLNNLNKSY